jgi:hypothetical protein
MLFLEAIISNSLAQKLADYGARNQTLELVHSATNKRHQFFCNDCKPVATAKLAVL